MPQSNLARRRRLAALTAVGAYKLALAHRHAVFRRLLAERGRNLGLGHRLVMPLRQLAARVPGGNGQRELGTESKSNTSDGAAK